MNWTVLTSNVSQNEEQWYLKNKLNLNTNTIDPKQHNEVNRMKITGDDQTLMFCVVVFKGRPLPFYLSTITLLHPHPPPPSQGSTQLNPNLFAISGVGSLVKVRREIHNFSFTKRHFVISTILFFVKIFHRKF